jgi:hypothetical protein
LWENDGSSVNFVRNVNDSENVAGKMVHASTVQLSAHTYCVHSLLIIRQGVLCN